MTLGVAGVFVTLGVEQARVGVPGVFVCTGVFGSEVAVSTMLVPVVVGVVEPSMSCAALPVCGDGVFVDVDVGVFVNDDIATRGVDVIGRQGAEFGGPHPRIQQKSKYGAVAEPETGFVAVADEHQRADLFDRQWPPHFILHPRR